MSPWHTSSRRRIIHHPLPISLVAHHPCEILTMMKFFYTTFHRCRQSPSILTWMKWLNIIRYKMFRLTPFTLCHPVTSIQHSLDVPHQCQQHHSRYPRYAPIRYRILLIPVTGTCQLLAAIKHSYWEILKTVKSNIAVNQALHRQLAGLDLAMSQMTDLVEQKGRTMMYSLPRQ